MSTKTSSPVGPPPAYGDVSAVCDVKLSLVDALGVGHSLRMLARDAKMPHGTREIYQRVGSQLVAAASSMMTEREGGRR